MSAAESPGERCFIALTPPAAVRGAVAELITPLPGVCWTRPQQLHVTLRFLGEVAAETIERVSERLAAIRVEPFILPTEGVGSFPPDAPPRVIWVGVGKGHPRLYQLRQRLDDSLLAAGLDLELRAFHPHVTVARCHGTPAAGIKKWLRENAGFEAAPFRVESFDLYASRPIPPGAEYVLLRRFSLGGSNAT
jgi:2'-5' RNA ligase